MSIQVANLPTAGTIATRPRKEGLYDTEGYDAGAVSLASLTLFSNARSFSGGAALATTGANKVFGRDTNLTGQGGQLPRGYHFYWYGIRAKVQFYTQDLSTAANTIIFEEVRQLREAAHFEFKFGTTPYIFAPLNEIPSGVGHGSTFTTHSASTVFPLAWGVPVSSNTYPVAVGQRPQELIEIEAFTVDIRTTAPNTITLTLDTYIQIYLTGVLLKGITG